MMNDQTHLPNRSCQVLLNGGLANKGGADKGRGKAKRTLLHAVYWSAGLSEALRRLTVSYG